MALAQVAIMVLPATRHSPRARGEGWGPIVRLIGLQGALVVDALLLGLFAPRARRLRLLLGHLANLDHDLGENVLAEGRSSFPIAREIRFSCSSVALFFEPGWRPPRRSPGWDPRPS